MPQAQAIEPTVIPTRTQLFLGFFKTGLSGFGGVMPHARRMLVDHRSWLEDRQFTMNFRLQKHP